MPTKLDSLITRRAADRRRLAAAAWFRVVPMLRGLGVEARLVGSLARGDFGPTSDVDILVTACPPDRRYAIEARVEDLLGALPFHVIYLDEVASPAFRVKLLAEARDAPAPG